MLVLWTYNFVHPRHELLNIGVDTRQVLPAAADAPGHETDEGASPLHLHRQRAPGVTLARVPPALKVKGVCYILWSNPSEFSNMHSNICNNVYSAYLFKWYFQ